MHSPLDITAKHLCAALAAGAALVLSLAPTAEAARRVRDCLTLDQLQYNIPESTLQGQDLVLCMRIRGCDVIALADRLGQIGAIFVLSGSKTDSGTVQEVTAALIKLLGEYETSSVRITCGGRAANVICLDEVLKANTPSSFCWLGASAVECIAVARIRHRGRVVGIDGTRLTVEIPHRSYTRMQTTVNLETASRIECLDCRLGRNIKRNASGVSSIASEYGLNNSEEIESEDMRSIMRLYQTKRPLIKGTAVMRDPQADTENDDGKVEVEFIGSVEGYGVRFATCDALVQAASERGRKSAFSYPEKDAALPDKLSPLPEPDDASDSPDATRPDSDNNGSKAGSPGSPNSGNNPAAAPSGPLSVEEARRLYIDRLRSLGQP